MTLDILFLASAGSVSSNNRVFDLNSYYIKMFNTFMRGGSTDEAPTYRKVLLTGNVN